MSWNHGVIHLRGKRKCSECKSRARHRVKIIDNDPSDTVILVKAFFCNKYYHKYAKKINRQMKQLLIDNGAE